ncbi:MAG: hypothetical protein AAB223_03675 [Pseudomonadota bacterium]
MSERRSISARWLPFVAFALLCTPPAEARAQDSDKIDPAAIRFITPSAASAPCIGKPATPMCGIETLIGCSRYIWNEACAVINSPVYPHVRKNVRVEYAIVKAGLVNRDKVRAAREASVDKEYGDEPWLTEDAFQAKVLNRTCPAEATTCEGVPWRVSVFTVSPHGRIPDVWSFSMYGVFRAETWFVD